MSSHFLTLLINLSRCVFLLIPSPFPFLDTILLSTLFPRRYIYPSSKRLLSTHLFSTQNDSSSLKKVSHNRDGVCIFDLDLAGIFFLFCLYIFIISTVKIYQPIETVFHHFSNIYKLVKNSPLRVVSPILFAVFGMR